MHALTATLTSLLPLNFCLSQCEPKRRFLSMVNVISSGTGYSYEDTPKRRVSRYRYEVLSVKYYDSTLYPGLWSYCYCCFRIIDTARMTSACNIHQLVCPSCVKSQQPFSMINQCVSFMVLRNTTHVRTWSSGEGNQDINPLPLTTSILDAINRYLISPYLLHHQTYSYIKSWPTRESHVKLVRYIFLLQTLTPEIRNGELYDLTCL